MRKAWIIIAVTTIFLFGCSNQNELLKFENEQFSFSYSNQFKVVVDKYPAKNDPYGFSSGFFPFQTFIINKIDFGLFKIEEFSNKNPYFIVFEDLEQQNWFIHLLGKEVNYPEDLEKIASTFAFASNYKEKHLEPETDKKLMEKPPTFSSDSTDYSQNNLFDGCPGLPAYSKKNFYQNLIKDLKINTEHSQDSYYMLEPQKIYGSDFVISDACYSEKLGRVLIAGSAGQLDKIYTIVVDYDTATRKIIRSNALLSWPGFKFNQRSGENIPLSVNTCTLITVCKEIWLNYNLRTRILSEIDEVKAKALNQKT